jgi:beta-galactosidase
VLAFDKFQTGESEKMKNAKPWVAWTLISLAVACGSQSSMVTPDGGGSSGSQTSNGSSGGSSGTTATPGSSTSSGGSSSGGAPGGGSGTATGSGSGSVAGSGSGSVAITGSDSGAGTGETGEGGTRPGGGTVGNPPAALPNRVRTVLPFDTGWLFNYGDAAGASGATVADTGWRAVNVPHDWSIEGPMPPANPFSMGAATTGRGAYAPSGISWYRKHFTLPQTLSGDRVYIEFDGVMENATFYVNGTQIGQHPFGYVSLRYDMTANVKFGTADNVVAVKTDTTVQPAERYYTGAGINRHVRVLVTNPVHVDQFATYVTTPAPTAASATVKVSTSVVNSGTTPQMVTVQGIVTDPSGAPLPAVVAPAQSIAAGAAAAFTFTVPVSNPKLWDLASPNMYSLVTNVQVGGTSVDDDVTPFGIREILFNAGMTINGKSTKFQGVAIHQDYHGLGAAPPQRAVQRRLAQLKAIGVNAIRIAHNPPSPDFLELTDRMGILVLDEFSDMWTAPKYTDVGDYSAYFLKAASTPTGMPAAPGVATGAPWWQVDLGGWLMRDRNHPSVVLHSMGNEIRDSIATRTPILTKMIAISHAIDSTRPVTQALFDPGTAGDVGGATNTLLDVWGNNYNLANCLQAMTSAPTKSGVLTEMTTPTGTWASVTSNPGLLGEFVWTGVEYLGEEPLLWPLIGGGGTANMALQDALGVVKATGQAWQKVWGVPVTANPPAGTTATQVVLKADHATITNDVNDISYVKAMVADASGAVVTSSTPITFAITGPGTIVAVDSGSMVQETFRGNVRGAFNGVAYALVQATGAGAIAVTASATGLTAGHATVTGTAGTFVPCSGTCD